MSWKTRTGAIIIYLSGIVYFFYPVYAFPVFSTGVALAFFGVYDRMVKKVGSLEETVKKRIKKPRVTNL
jgi:hypothetical protein